MQVHFGDRESWRSWLDENHCKAREVWLVFATRSIPDGVVLRMMLRLKRRFVLAGLTALLNASLKTDTHGNSRLVPIQASGRS